MTGNHAPIDIETLKEYFKTHTLGQCAKRFGRCASTIKRYLKQAGVDSSIHNHGPLALAAYRATRKDTSILTEEFLREQFITLNKDTKTIAEENGFHFNTIRLRLRKLKITKPLKLVSASMMNRHQLRTGYRHPGQRPDVLEKIFKCRSRFHYQPLKSDKSLLFKSLHELCFALGLDQDPAVQSWDYELIQVPYIDRITGQTRLYYVDFSVHYLDHSEWIEIKPAASMLPMDKYLYASHAAKAAQARFRGLQESERQAIFAVFLDGYRREAIEFQNPSQLRLDRTYTLWFKDKAAIEQVKHDHYLYPEQCGVYWRCKFVAKKSNRHSHRPLPPH
jgi:hypothetical protein